jgi:hypothetical protein
VPLIYIKPTRFLGGCENIECSQDAARAAFRSARSDNPPAFVSRR